MTTENEKLVAAAEALFRERGFVQGKKLTSSDMRWEKQLTKNVMNPMPRLVVEFCRDNTKLMCSLIAKVDEVNHIVMRTYTLSRDILIPKEFNRIVGLLWDAIDNGDSIIKSGTKELKNPRQQN